MNAQAAYLDSCVLLSLFLQDSGYESAERWLLSQGDQPLWVSHWVLLEFAGAINLCVRRGDLAVPRAQAIQAEFDNFRQERLSLVEPRGVDFLQARQWLEEALGTKEAASSLHAADALHLAIALRQGLGIATADVQLARAAKHLGMPCQHIA